MKGVVKPEGTVTAGNASGINDGACALLIASEEAAHSPQADSQGPSSSCGGRGCRSSNNGYGSCAGRKKSPGQSESHVAQMDVIELNEAFASQALAVLRELGLPDDAAHINPNGGAIAIGHPLGPAERRLITTAAYQLNRTNGRYALCTMCIGVGQGIAIILEKV